MLIIIHEPRAGTDRLEQEPPKIVPPKPTLKSSDNVTRTEHFRRTALALTPPPYSNNKLPLPPMPPL